MRYKKIILAMGIAALAILYGIYKASPIISKSLEDEGFKLISNAVNREEIYKRMLARYENDINKDIKLDEFLTSKDQKWAALSFWCDVGTSGKKFFVSLDNYKKYCVMGIVDYLVDGKLVSIGDDEDGMYVDQGYMIRNTLHYQKLFLKQGIKWVEDNFLKNREAWISWCKVQKYLEKEELTKKTVELSCLKSGLLTKA